MKLTSSVINQILEEYKEALSQTKLKKVDVDAFMESTSQTLLDYAAQFPEDTEFEYRIRNLFHRRELRISIPGDKKDIYECGQLSEEREVMKQIRSLKIGDALEMQYLYLRGKNVIQFLSPPVKNTRLLRNPVVLASLAGIVLGLLCSLLPENVSGVLINDIASPVLNLVIFVITAVMGPVIFLSLVTAISVAESIGEVNRLGSKILKRFLLIAIAGTILAAIITLIVFPFTGGHTEIDISVRTFVDMILKVIPTNLLTPFTENNFPQLLVLGIVLGVALLFLNRKDSTINRVLSDVRDWLNELLRLVLKLTPIIPGLTFFKLFAQGEFSGFLQGWKFIAAMYICMAIGMIVKVCKVKLRCKELNLSTFFKKTAPAAKVAFISGVELVAFKQTVDTAEGPLGISKNFSSLWIPLNQSMLAPTGPYYFVLAPFFIAQITGTPVSISFIFVLLILSIQLSLAFPGTTAGNTIIFASLGLSTDYVGLFSVYSVFVRNAASAYGIFFRTLEMTEAAYKTGNLNIETFNRPVSE